jgi:hypothetical protein
MMLLLSLYDMGAPDAIVGCHGFSGAAVSAGKNKKGQGVSLGLQVSGQLFSRLTKKAKGFLPLASSLLVSLFCYVVRVATIRMSCLSVFCI